MRLYLAGGLFNAGQRLHNLYLEKYLKVFGHEVILPQRRALALYEDGKFDTKEIPVDCAKCCVDKDLLYVGCIDGADADSGTAIEYGLAIGATHRAIIYRTDFRTDTEKELGVNAMFGINWTILVCLPCFLTEFNQINDYYQRLARKIHEAIVAISSTE